LIGLPFWGATKCRAQEIHVGEHIPNIKITHICNYSKTELDLVDLRGKDIILDFGDIRCHGCLESLHKFDSLQQVYEGEVQFFWVTKDSIAEVARFLKTNKIGKTLKYLPIIAEDSVFFKRFPLWAIPYDVWIDKYSNVVSESLTSFVNKSSIDFLIQYK